MNEDILVKVAPCGDFTITLLPVFSIRCVQESRVCRVLIVVSLSLHLITRSYVEISSMFSGLNTVFIVLSLLHVNRGLSYQSLVKSVVEFLYEFSYQAIITRLDCVLWTERKTNGWHKQKWMVNDKHEHDIVVELSTCRRVCSNYSHMPWHSILLFSSFVNLFSFLFSCFHPHSCITHCMWLPPFVLYLSTSHSWGPFSFSSDSFSLSHTHTQYHMHTFYFISVCDLILHTKTLYVFFV